MHTVLSGPIRGTAAWRRTHEVKQRYLAAGDPDAVPPRGVRREIVASWRRCLLSGVDATSTDLPRDDGAAPPDRLVRAAQPIAERLTDHLSGMRMWAFLADRECRLVWYVVGLPELQPALEARGAFPGAWFAEDVVGTNGLGTAVEERRPFIVAGSEHFREYESHVTTVGAPVRDPATGRLVGLLNLNCPYELTNGLLLPFVIELARSIEERLRTTAPSPRLATGDGDDVIDDRPVDLSAGPRHLTKLERLERQALVSALIDARGDRVAAARDLGISRATVYRKLKRFGISTPADGV